MQRRWAKLPVVLVRTTLILRVRAAADVNVRLQVWPPQNIGTVGVPSTGPWVRVTHPVVWLVWMARLHPLHPPSVQEPSVSLHAIVHVQLWLLPFGRKYRWPLEETVQVQSPSKTQAASVDGRVTRNTLTTRPSKTHRGREVIQGLLADVGGGEGA